MPTEEQRCNVCGVRYCLLRAQAGRPPSPDHWQRGYTRANERAEGLAKELEAAVEAYARLTEDGANATARVAELEKQLAEATTDLGDAHEDGSATAAKWRNRADKAEAELARLRALPDCLREELESKLIGVVLADVALWGDSAEGLDGPGMERLSEVLVNAIHAALAAPLPSAQQVGAAPVDISLGECSAWTAPAPQATPAQPPPLEGSWPMGCVQRAFVLGAKWWQFEANGATAFPSEVDQMEAEAVRRYGEPIDPRKAERPDWHPFESPAPAPAAPHEGEK